MGVALNINFVAQNRIITVVPCIHRGSQEIGILTCSLGITVFFLMAEKQKLKNLLAFVPFGLYRPIILTG